MQQLLVREPRAVLELDELRSAALDAVDVDRPPGDEAAVRDADKHVGAGARLEDDPLGLQVPLPRLRHLLQHYLPLLVGALAEPLQDHTLRHRRRQDHIVVQVVQVDEVGRQLRAIISADPFLRGAARVDGPLDVPHVTDAQRPFAAERDRIVERWLLIYHQFLRRSGLRCFFL